LGLNWYRRYIGSTVVCISLDWRYLGQRPLSNAGLLLEKFVVGNDFHLKEKKKDNFSVTEGGLR